MTGKRAAPNQARHIINLLGGRTEAASILGWPLTKIDSCLRYGWIQCRDMPHVLLSAWSAGININQLDFVVHLVGLERPAAGAERTAALG